MQMMRQQKNKIYKYLYKYFNKRLNRKRLSELYDGDPEVERKFLKKFDAMSSHSVR